MNPNPNLNSRCEECQIIGHFKRCCKKLGNFPNNHSNQQNQSSSTGSGRMNVATAVPQLDAEFFNEKGLPKIYNLPTAPQIGSMNILKKVQQNDAILISEEEEEIHPIEQPNQPNNIPSVSGSVPGPVPPSDFSQIEFPLTKVVNQSQIDSPSISDTFHLRETGNSSKKASRSTDFPLKSVQNTVSDEEMRETKDLNISAKPTQSTIDSCAIATPNNSTIKKSMSGTQTDMIFEDWYEISFNKKGKDVSVKPLKVLQDSLPDAIHFIEKGFQLKTVNSTQRKGEDGKDTAFQLIQKIHIQLQQVQENLQRLHSMHKYEF